MKSTAAALVLCACAVLPAFGHDEPAVAVPKYYTVGKHCVPGRGFVAIPSAPGHPPSLPFMALLVFNNEVVGFLFEAHEKDGWKPWYGQPEGQPISHGGGPKHYSQAIMIRKGPSEADCKAAKAP